MGKIILTCGHEEPTQPTGWSLYTKDWDEFGEECLVYASYCVDCLAKQLRNHPDTTFFGYDEAWEAVFGQEK